MSRGARILLSGIVAVAPQAALACTVCGEAAEEVRQVLLGSTIFLSLLPLFLIFGGVGLLWWYAGKPTLEERPHPRSTRS